MKRLVYAVAIKDKEKILLVKKGVFWTLPGGELELNEDAENGLRKRFREEFLGTEIGDLLHYKRFNSSAFNVRGPSRADVYFADIRGELYQPSDEISDIRWASGLDGCTVSDTTRQILRTLRNGGYLSSSFL